MGADRSITVYGAYGHTGRFVVGELLLRGWTPVLAGRDEDKLGTIGEEYSDLERRTASVDDPASLDDAVAGSVAIINCAGPFMDTAVPLVEAAIRSRAHYLDVTAEQPSALTIFEHFADAAREAGIVVAPAVAFYGGLGDLLATAAVGDWGDADEIDIAVALDSWQPTRGTRITGQRNTARRLVFSDGRLTFLPEPAPTRRWDFPAPFGRHEVVGLPLAEIITISRHLQVGEINSFMNLAPLRDLRDPDTPSPDASDVRGRSAQVFVMDVIARKGSERRRATATGRDIYAITAPIVVEAATRLVDGKGTRSGVFSIGELVDAQDFLRSLSPGHLAVDIEYKENKEQSCQKITEALSIRSTPHLTDETMRTS